MMDRATGPESGMAGRLDQLSCPVKSSQLEGRGATLLLRRLLPQLLCHRVSLQSVRSVLFPD